MANSSISYFLPSQEEMDSPQILLDCLEKLKILILPMFDNEFFLKYVNQASFNKYLSILTDLIEIAITKQKEIMTEEEVT